MISPITTDLEFVPLADYGLDRAAHLLTRAFADYGVKISFTAESLLQRARTESVDFRASQVVLRSGVAAGAALIGRRGETSRLAGMGLASEARRRGIGSALLRRVIDQAKNRGERAMVLEVIEQNEAAVSLYTRLGFKKVRRLVGYFGFSGETGQATAAVEETDLRVIGALVTKDSIPDLPWQLSGETIRQLPPPSIGFRRGNAWMALSNLTEPQVMIRAIGTAGEKEPKAAADLLRAVMSQYPNKEWRMTAIWPEEDDAVFREARLVRLPLSQWQMKRDLGA